MVERQVIVTNEAGLHARPAALFVKTAQTFKSKVVIKHGEREADAKSILGVMGLGITKGTPIIIWAEGEDEREAVEALEKLVASNFGEGE
ncbi:phosphocarrier protein [Thermanaeromonas toyohensis ToBE]|uniref:Phosphocarrier protein HPr n=1 Tax=Thermanaeromonas toyohensis ToBE TaxID=698762 RepID=A0A1W1W241_9FIRM|nr:HPr family phosphocarrier protein [Thermanaeromonas toyohensis]SMB99678.1 phosphocarrier protein [Thermanaeromonas toyohensis ToBE]